ncbi:MAG TPA: hypothetical protein VMW23_04240 [Sedimentisphaerales bacterium]|nr:hypothetical protein [Sedimentisphaerales bacterium]
MGEEGNNFPQEGSRSGRRPFDKLRAGGEERLADDAVPLCGKCLKPCHPLQNYCHWCGSNQVINPLASYMPFVNIRFNYGGLLIMWRKVWYRKDTRFVSRLFYLLAVTVAAPIFLVIAFPLLVIGKLESPMLQKIAAGIVVIVMLGLLLALGLWLN